MQSHVIFLQTGSTMAKRKTWCLRSWHDESWGSVYA